MPAEREFLDTTMPYLDAIHALARRLTDGQEAAEDLVQETYLRAFAGFAGRRGGSVRPWLVAICLNTARSSWRRARIRPSETLVDFTEPAWSVAGDARSPDDPAAEALDRVERQAISRALARLSQPQREAVVAVDLAGLTAQEAAEALGCPRGTILSRVHRSRRRLAELLEEEGVHRGA